MTRKFLREMLDEARSKDQQIKGQRAMLDQKIKAEYDKLTKEVPSPSQRRKKKRVTDIQESDWTPISGPGPTNSASQSFQHFSGSTVTVSGLGGVESTPSTVTIGLEGETFDVAAPTYNQLAMQGYAPPLPMLKRRDNVNVNARLDASQEFAQKVGSDAFMNARVQSGEFTPKQQAAIDAWNDELRSTMDRHGAEWEAVLKKDGGYDPEKHKGLQARHDAEMDALWNKEPKFDEPPDPSVPLDYNPPEPGPMVDPYADRILELNVALDKMKEKGTLISRYELIGPGEEGYVDTTNMANAIGYNRKPIYTAPAQEMFAELERLYALQLAWLEKQNPGGAVPGADDALDDYNSSMGPNSEPPEDPYAMEDPVVNPEDEDEDDEDFLSKMDMLSKAAQSQLMQMLNLPGEAAAWAVQYAKGDNTPVNKFSPAFKNQVLDLIGNAVESGSDSVQYHNYNTDNPFSNLSTRLGLGRFNYERTPNGVRVTDTFNVDKFGTHTGAAQIVPGLQGAANRLVNIAHKRRGNSTSGIPIDVFIPKSQMNKTQRKRIFGESTWNKMNRFIREDYKNLPRDRMAKQYDRKKDKNFDEFHKQNPMGIGPRVSRGKSDTQIDQHGNSRQTKAISGQLKNNPRFYDSSHEQWQRMQSKFKSQKNSDATGEVARRLNPSRKKKKL